MSNRTIVELNHDYCPRTNVRDLLVWALQMRHYMGSADPDSLPNGVTFLHYRHHSEPLPLVPQKRTGHGRIRPDIAAKIVDDMLAALYAPEQEGASEALPDRAEARDTPKSHYCLDCNKQWFGDTPPCDDKNCPFKASGDTPNSKGPDHG